MKATIIYKSGKEAHHGALWHLWQARYGSMPVEQY